MGLQFLKHLSRTGLLLHMVDIAPYESDESPVSAARKIIREVEKWSDELAHKPRWLVLNKIDNVPDDEVESLSQQIVEELGWTGPVFLISTLKNQGTQA